LGVCPYELFQFPKKGIVFTVADDGFVERVITVVVLLDLPPQFLNAPLYIHLKSLGK
jgi:hypothetical protein